MSEVNGIWNQTGSSTSAPIRKGELRNNIKDDIAAVVRHLTLTTGGGTCALRALVGNATLRILGLEPRLTYGGLLYRAGPHPMRDTIMYCDVGNVGRIKQGREGGMYGHIWNEVGDDLIDFSTGDWKREAELFFRLCPDEFGPVQWEAELPTYLWQSAAPLKAAWRSDGEPPLGEFWYGKWASPTYPDTSDLDWSLNIAVGQIEANITHLRLRERLATV